MAYAKSPSSACPMECAARPSRLFVVEEPGAGLDPQTIIDHCEERLASFKVPSYVEFVEELPRGSYGKVNKQLLATS